MLIFLQHKIRPKFWYRSFCNFGWQKGNQPEDWQVKTSYSALLVELCLCFDRSPLCVRIYGYGRNKWHSPSVVDLKSAFQSPPWFPCCCVHLTSGNTKASGKIHGGCHLFSLCHGNHSETGSGVRHAFLEVRLLPNKIVLLLYYHYPHHYH